jgi:hypothetical protein
MSVLPLKADIRQREWHVRFVPLADIIPLVERERAIFIERRCSEGATTHGVDPEDYSCAPVTRLPCHY